LKEYAMAKGSRRSKSRTAESSGAAPVAESAFGSDDGAGKAGARRLTGTSSPDFDLSVIHQVLNALWMPCSTDKQTRDREAAALIAAMADLAPRDGAEGMLAAQMIATHHSAMECFRRAMLQGQTFEGREANLKHAVRLSKAYIDLLAALNKHRGRGQQKITVEHVTVEAGGQAIVGSVQTGDNSQSGQAQTRRDAGRHGLVIESTNRPSVSPRHTGSGNEQGESESDGKNEGRGQGAIAHQADAVMAPVKSRRRSPVRRD
jgi:hypothetical protein